MEFRSKPTAEELRERFYNLAPGAIISSEEAWLEGVSDIHTPPSAVRPFDWHHFDKFVGGFRPYEFTILCGSTGSGKTSWLANLSAKLICAQINHMVAPVETGTGDFARRVGSVILGEDLNDGRLRTKDHVESIERDLSFAMRSNHLKLSMVDNRMSSMFLIEKLRYVTKELGCKIAMLDNLNFFLSVTSANEQNMEMDRVVHDVVMFCKSNPIHVIMVMHPKKTDNGRVESEFDIKGSSTAVQEAHNIFLFNRMKSEDVKNGVWKSTNRELKIAKLRRRGAYAGRSIIYDGTTPEYLEETII